MAPGNPNLNGPLDDQLGNPLKQFSFFLGFLISYTYSAFMDKGLYILSQGSPLGLLLNFIYCFVNLKVNREFRGMTQMNKFLP